MNSYDVVILGGGAAGLMCGIVAGARGRRVVVLEGSNKAGKKILMSGGGRCNFTNLHCTPQHFLSANPRFCVSALSRYSPADFVALVNRHHIPFHEKADGQLFCDRSSKDILAMLLDECARANVTVCTHCDVSTVSRDGLFTVVTDKGNFSSDALVVATGGLSIPKMGASDFGYRIARQFGLPVRETTAGLVPFTFSGAMHEMTDRLSGVSLRARVSTNQQSFTGDILFTHRGMSGPAALQLSNYWSPGDAIGIDIFPDRDAATCLLDAKTEQPRALVRTCLAGLLPRALVIELQNVIWPEFAEKPLGEIANETLRMIGTRLNSWQVRPSGTEGYRTAEVTIGGIDTDELSSKTMECRRHPGLFFIGEVVDVTGHLGGFNFQWAWASANAAGRVA